MFSLLLLGPPQILHDGRPLEISRRKSRAVLFYLAVRHTPATRDQLLTLFWPDHERAAAQQLLRTTLHGLRKALGAALLITPDTVALSQEIPIDCRRFEQQIGLRVPAEQLALSLALYRGPLLEGFSLPDGEQFERWVQFERERFQQLALRGFMALAQLHEQQQNFPAALSSLTRAMALDALHEEVQQAIMRVQYRSGDRAGAIRRYEQLRDLLDDELGVPPMLETRSLYDAIITDTLDKDTQRTVAVKPPRMVATSVATTLPAASTSMLPFAGRSDELARISVAAEAGRLVLIEGEAGIGKSRLAQEWLREQAALVLKGAAYELERALPYQPVIEALRDLCETPAGASALQQLSLAPLWQAEVARLLPELGEPHQITASPADEPRLWEAVRQLLVALARARPLVLFLDDLHWADTSTLALLGYLARQTNGVHVTLLGTARATTARSELATLIQTLTRNGRIERIPVRRLSPAELTALTQALSATDSAPLAAWLQPASEGNPYVLAELIRYARERTWLTSSGALDVAALQQAVVPQSIYSLVESRLAPLGPDARVLLDVAVAAGREFEFALVALASGLSEQRALDALDELRAAMLLQPADEQRFRFDHSLTMEVAYREIGEPRHRTLHRRLAEAMAEHTDGQGELAGVIATHFVEGNAPERAAPFAMRAGQRAMSLAAWQEASTLFELALRGDPGDRLAALIALGEARTNFGASAQASEVLREAVALAEQRHHQHQAAQARMLLARALIPQGRYAEVIATVGPLLVGEEAASAEFFWGAALSLEGADLQAARDHLNRSQQLLAAQPLANDTISSARIKLELGNIAAQQGDIHTAVQLFRELVDTTSLEPDPTVQSWQVLGHNNLAYHLHLLGDPQAIEYARIGLALAQEKGLLGHLPYLHSTIGEILLAAGDLDGAEWAFHEGLRLSEELHMAERIAGLSANLGLVARARGQDALAIHLLSTGQTRADALGTRHLAAQIRIWLAPLLPPEQRRATLAEARDLAESGGRQRLLAEIAALE
ncbi:MAG: AAA family ATPase [Roseiflexaceae bacterium]|nr:AAA family ATPase [Roseiflexaceae bacterium]